MIPNQKCASAAANPGDLTPYYSEFEYKGKRVVVSSGVPDHVAENNTDSKNPNWRCEWRLAY